MIPETRCQTSAYRDARVRKVACWADGEWKFRGAQDCAAVEYASHTSAKQRKGQGKHCSGVYSCNGIYMRYFNPTAAYWCRAAWVGWLMQSVGAVVVVQ